MGFKRVEPSKVMKGIKFYIVEDLAKILDLSTGAVRGYLRKGRISSVKVGQRFWVSEKNLSDFLMCRGIRDLPDDKFIEMIHKAVEIKYTEWTDLMIPKVQKLVADYLLKKEKERNKITQEFKKEMKLVYSIKEQLEGILPKKTGEHIRYIEKEQEKEQSRYQGKGQEKELEKV